MPGYTDVHQHIVYGLDDGAQSRDMSIEMLRAACQDGVTTLFATPHATPGEIEFPMEKYTRRLAELSAYCAENALPLKLLPGAEILYTEHTARHLRDGLVPTLGGGVFTLVEFFPGIPYEALFQAVRQIANAGYTPIIAHIERYECLVKDYRRAYELKELVNLRLQVNASSLVRPKGFWAKRFLKRLLAAQAIDYIATDAHDVTHRPTCFGACVQALEGVCPGDYIVRLTEINQREILS